MREEKEREKRELQASLFNLRSSIELILSGQGLKFIASTRGMREYLKQGISQKIQGNLGKIKVFGLESVFETSYRCFYAPRGRDPSYLGLFSTFGLIEGLFGG